MIQTIIFDLSEVLIAGLLGIEKTLAKQLALPEAQVISAFGGTSLDDLLCGSISEELYLEQIIERQGWPISSDGISHLQYHLTIPNGALARYNGSEYAGVMATWSRAGVSSKRDLLLQTPRNR